MITGNKGEWSEFYALIKLLAEGRLYAANKDLDKIENMYFPVLSVHRIENNIINSGTDQIDYDIPVDGADYIVVSVNDEFEKTIERKQLSDSAKILYNKILEGGDRAFAIPTIESLMNKMLCSHLAASSADKTDINMTIHDIQTGYDEMVGFSIKSELGSAPSLLNASKATNFVFKVNGLSEGQMYDINAINGKTKIIDRMRRILRDGTIEYAGMANDNFAANLMLIDTEMEKLIGEALLVYYSENISQCKSVIEIMEKENPLKFPRHGFYKYKFKKFLCSVALGMFPSKEWNGLDDANGGYIVVKKTGDVVAFHIYNRNYFEEYLLENTKFERGSTTRHDFATIYQKNGDMYMNLNLQIRFI